MSFFRAVSLLAVVAAAACGGGGESVPLDAAPDAVPDAAIDGPPPCNGMVCDSVCFNTAEDEDHCGSCTTVCDPGQECASGVCSCPGAFVPAMPSFLQEMILTTTIPNTSLGIGAYIGAEIDALIVAKPDAAQLNVAYPLSGTTPGMPPFVAAGYDIDINTMLPTASFYATAGTVTFTTQCTGGFSGVATNLTFSAASGLMPPMLVPNGCTFMVPTVTFTFGPACP